jgi:bifunctional non-homologous end joining protein LigD
MLATLSDGPFDDPAWIYEVKWDGYRLLVEVKKGKATLVSATASTFQKSIRASARPSLSLRRMRS